MITIKRLFKIASHNSFTNSKYLPIHWIIFGISKHLNKSGFDKGIEFQILRPQILKYFSYSIKSLRNYPLF